VAIRFLGEPSRMFKLDDAIDTSAQERDDCRERYDQL
jgi:hypothetical protein